MPDYRRARLAGGTYFFTLVTHRRRPILATRLGLRAQGYALRRVRRLYPFELRAFCVLPDHLHAVWTLPPDDSGFSRRWGAIKSLFTRRYRDLGGEDASIGPSRLTRGERGLWQRRFWEHTIRDERDLRRHVDYVHYNPVKHGYVTRPGDWPWSSFHRYVREGMYDLRWGEGEPPEVDLGHGAGE
jgi:putative transposase